jgi:hypothetical protein
MTKGQKIEALEVLKEMIDVDIRFGRASWLLSRHGVTGAVEQKDMEDWLTWKVQDLIEQEMTSDD